ncbi:conserved hypothetical protein [Talaromyces stipitatus ATCC 10500]|uniref:Zn(2)-C6 fungal-type domain-containing protein n=1 Tax=Talaromyces stipitatus (strain ATCC 10500 / CBS 375.48 / QM 6759 / NRRL 1006) TaxID=441959 RepID=B8MRH1_TALSN|nr:uncharacterized protein TSTA_056080 [Talaromyces stipitatus ATCC 10500]EED13108.1 conserved hypothetical protein [Talaromyces stipitatus ATCC 10500]
MSEDADDVAPKQPPPSSTTAPRKKRKRKATGGGAADDCFTCSSAGLSCDRRRPYCSQCLDHGRDCAGYKTTLTWGVGVASRGKFRGLSLPVSDGIQPTSPPSPGTKQRKQSTVSSNPVASALPTAQQPRRKSSTNFPVTVTAERHAPHPSAASPLKGPQHPSNWQHPAPPFATATTVSELIFPESHNHAADGSLGALQYPTDGSLYTSNAPLVPPRTSTAATRAWAVPSTAASTYPVVSRHNADYHGRIQRPQTGFYVWPQPITGKRRASSIEDDDIEQQEYVISPVYSDPVYMDQFPVFAYQPTQDPWKFAASPFANSLPDLLLEQSVGRTPRMRYLISYFAEVIAPVIVAFDRPSNPYRTRILQLAHHSETLQHAIAALAASNIRQRREEKILSTERTEQARKSSMAHRALTDVSFQERHGIQDLGGDNREEVYHKSLAVKSLNALLADPDKRHHDSVLASLLVLCLFHICETGVAQFQTQFAGVRKLLAMRHRLNIPESEEARWCTRMFTWFDAMTATINNREGQLQGLYLDMTCASDEEWAMENLAGCDGRLFKVMARLGRLNLLSQNQHVDPSYNIDMPAAMPVVPPALSHFTPNGMNAAYAATLYAHPQSAQWGNPEFWAEWHSIRQQLESWRLDPTQFAGALDINQLTQSPSNSCGSLSATSGPTIMSSPTTPNSSVTVAPSNLADLSNISEAFRYAALLYTERLAHPGIPSTHPRIQTFVLTAMHYIAAVQSDVYLLWPLFITGSECVYEEHRTAIRNRCRDIQNDSGFYNNISCLELLEKIWAQNPPVASQQQQHLSVPYQSHQNLYPSHGYSGTPVSNIRAQTLAPNTMPQDGAGFRWRSIIEGEGVDGEYMFVKDLVVADVLFEDEALGCARCSSTFVFLGCSRTRDFDVKESVTRRRIAGLVEGFVGTCEVDEVVLVEGEDDGAEGLKGVENNEDVCYKEIL